MRTILYATLFVLLVAALVGLAIATAEPPSVPTLPSLVRTQMVPAPTLTSVDGSFDEACMGRLTRSRSNGMLTTERQA